jgi:hypothetical protein
MTAHEYTVAQRTQNQFTTKTQSGRHKQRKNLTQRKEEYRIVTKLVDLRGLLFPGAAF